MFSSTDIAPILVRHHDRRLEEYQLLACKAAFALKLFVKNKKQKQQESIISILCSMGK